jgi:hypothetical protein
MYEMKGALSGRAAPGRPVAQLPRHHAPPDGAKHPPELPVSRLFRCPEVAPGRCPFPTVRAFLLPLRGSRKSPREFIFSFFSVHRTRAVIRTSQRLSTGFCTLHPQFIHRLPGVTQRMQKMVAETWAGEGRLQMLEVDDEGGHRLLKSPWGYAGIVFVLTAGGGALMAGGEYKPVTVSRRIGSPASVIFQVRTRAGTATSTVQGCCGEWYPARGSRAWGMSS